MLKRILIIANPGSGKGEASKHVEKLSDVLKEEYDSEIDIRETTKFGDAKNWAQAAKDEKYDTVICLGGDGTVNEVVNGLMLREEPPVFSFVPIGTVNNLGRVLGFGMNPETAIEQFRNLDMDSIDIGQVNEQYFISSVAVGDIPMATMETDSEQKNRLGFLAYVAEGAKAVVEGEGKEYHVTNSNGEVFKFTSNAIIIPLTSSVGGVENIIEHRDYKDGLLQFIALKGNVVASTLKTLAKNGGIPVEPTNNETLLAFSGNEVSLQLLNNEEKMSSNVDGDKGPELPLNIKVHKEALRVLKPRIEEERVV